MALNSRTTSVQSLTVADANEVKIEGTSTTYGQNIQFPPVTEDSVHPTSQQTSEGTPFNQSYTRSSSLSSVLRVIRSIIPSSIPSFGFQSKRRGKPRVSPQHTLVRVVQKVNQLEEAVSEIGTLTNFSCKVKSSVAVAAASSNANTVVVLPFRGLKLSSLRPTSLVRTALNVAALSVPNIQETAVVIGSEVKTKEEIKEILTEAQKVDLVISLKSPMSEKLDINFIKIPAMEVDFVYNFFTENEEDVESQEDQSNDPLLTNRPIDTPRYVELKWSVADITEPIAGTENVFFENKAFRRSVFSHNKGVSGHNSTNFNNSVFKSRKIYKLLNRDGLIKTIVDIHAPEKAFNSIANEKVFANSVCAVVNTRSQSGEIGSLPFAPTRQRFDVGEKK